MRKLTEGRNFAANIGIRYKAPEEYFLNEEARPFARTFDPLLYMDDARSGSELQKEKPLFEKINSLDIVLFCGSPGAGKSTLYWQVLEPLGYERVNQDTLKTVSWLALNAKFGLTGGTKRNKCLKVAADHLSSRRSVAVGRHFCSSHRQSVLPL